MSTIAERSWPRVGWRVHQGVSVSTPKRATDLLKAQVEIEIDTVDVDREMDRDDCQRKLIIALKEVLPGIKIRKYS